jgi:phosphohistidine phosphatase
MKELCLLRHGKSDRSLSVSDFERPLKKRGKRDAQNMGAWLKRQHLFPDVLLSSPAKRTFETATIVHHELDNWNLAIEQDQRLYEATVQQLKHVLAACPETAQRVLLVGHNPELEDLLTHLVGAQALPQMDKLFPTATLARLQISCAWADLHAHCAQLISLTYAKSLTEEN